MIFNSYIFLIAFLPAVFAVFWIIRGRAARLVWLTAAGLAFYGYWNWRFLPLLLGSAALSMLAALWIERAQKSKRIALAVGIAAHLGILAIFKYSNFFLSSVAAAADRLGLDVAFPTLALILPLGISFATFQAISYLVDVYRGTIPAERRPLRFLAYATLFPNLISGPILRYREIAPDFERVGNRALPSMIHRGAMLFVIGLFKKVIVADTLAETINPLWASPETLGAAGAWLATIGYGLQLYFDFSGYSDMAIGLGALFGLAIPRNFNSPYKALSPSDFWRRWHMTLGTWIRDYLYIPLGGSRRGLPRTATNLLLVMTLIGLWHGANWTFVVWGAWHGALLAAYHLVRRPYDLLPALMRRAITWFAVTIGWVAFRSPDLPSTLNVLSAMFRPLSALALPEVSAGFLILLVAAFLATQLLPNSSQLSFSPSKRAAFAAALALATCLVFLNYKQAAFLYYQF